MTDDIRAIQAQAQLLVDSFIMTHGAAAIPALVGATVLWAVEHGAHHQVKHTLDNSKALADNLQSARLRGAS